MPKVAIVGSGVAGSLMAWKLAVAGFQVLLLEAGPAVSRGRAASNFGEFEDPARTYPSTPDQPRWGDEHVFYDQQGPENFAAVYEKLVGGTTWHWLGTSLRFLANDFQLRSRYGVGRDWPITLSQLDPFYAEAERELGVAGAAMPALQATYLDQQIGAAAATVGYRVEVLNAARNSVPYAGRPACRGSATCLPICPIGAKYDASVHVSKAVAAGVELWSSTQVQRLLTKEGRVVGLEAIREGVSQTVDADLFIVAANAIETPRLLLYSGLPNPYTGRFLMGMAGQVSQALAPKPVWPFRSPQVVSGITQFRDGAFRRQRAAFTISIGNDGWPSGAPPRIAADLIEQGLRGKALGQALRDHVSRQILLVSNCEELPRPENRICLSDKLDSYGIPRPRLHYKVGQYTKDSIDECVLIHARIFQALGANHIHHFEESADPAHLAGTCRMGPAADSVVDSDLRSHNWPNLYVVGSSVFAGVGSAPPTLTIAALALRCAYNLAKTRSS